MKNIRTISRGNAGVAQQFTAKKTSGNIEFINGKFNFTEDITVKGQPIGGGGGVPEAPVDGNAYLRKDATWEPLLLYLGGFTFEPGIMKYAGQTLIDSSGGSLSYTIGGDQPFATYKADANISLTAPGVDLPSLTIAAIDAAPVTSAVTKEWVQANAGGTGSFTFAADVMSCNGFTVIDYASTGQGFDLGTTSSAINILGDEVTLSFIDPDTGDQYSAVNKGWVQANTIGDAPSDGTPYSRQDAGWVAATVSSIDATAGGNIVGQVGWLDGNPTSEDRTSLFVSLQNGLLVKCSDLDDCIGVTDSVDDTKVVLLGNATVKLKTPGDTGNRFRPSTGGKAQSHPNKGYFYTINLTTNTVDVLIK